MRNMKRLFAKDHRETALEGLSNAQMPQLKELDISAISYSKKCGDSLLQFLASNSFESFTCLNLEVRMPLSAIIIIIIHFPSLAIYWD
jgi:flagellar biosynthesis/type III secretory pathway M-ring protein FliF/YscJ